jgi:hypothetical protein
MIRFLFGAEKRLQENRPTYVTDKVKHLHLVIIEIIKSMVKLMLNPETKLRWILRCLQTSKAPRWNDIPFQPAIGASEKGVVGRTFGLGLGWEKGKDV